MELETILLEFPELVPSKLSSVATGKIIDPLEIVDKLIFLKELSNKLPLVFSLIVLPLVPKVIGVLLGIKILEV